MPWHRLGCDPTSSASRCAKPGEPRAAPTGMGQERPPHAAIFRDGAADLLGICAQLSFSSLRMGLAVPGGAGTWDSSSCLSPQLPNPKEGIGLQLRSKDAGRAQPGTGCPLPHLAVPCHTWLSRATPGCPQGSDLDGDGRDHIPAPHTLWDLMRGHVSVQSCGTGSVRSLITGISVLHLYIPVSQQVCAAQAFPSGSL